VDNRQLGTHLAINVGGGRRKDKNNIQEQLTSWPRRKGSWNPARNRRGRKKFTPRPAKASNHNGPQNRARRDDEPRALARPRRVPGSPTRFTASTTAWALYLESSRASPAQTTPTALRADIGPGRHDRSALSWARERIAVKSQREVLRSRDAGASGTKVEEDPAEEVEEMTLFYQLRVLSRRRPAAPPSGSARILNRWFTPGPKRVGLSTEFSKSMEIERVGCGLDRRRGALFPSSRSSSSAASRPFVVASA